MKYWKKRQPTKHDWIYKKHKLSELKEKNFSFKKKSSKFEGEIIYE